MRPNDCDDLILIIIIILLLVIIIILLLLIIIIIIFIIMLIMIITIILIVINQTCTAPTTFSPTPQKGVGGTRALAHSIYVYIPSTYITLYSYVWGSIASDTANANSSQEYLWHLCNCTSGILCPVMSGLQSRPLRAQYF